jgi:hypothetical protein
MSTGFRPNVVICRHCDPECLAPETFPTSTLPLKHMQFFAASPPQILVPHRIVCPIFATADTNTIRNLSDLAVTLAVPESFKKTINALTVREKGNAEISTACVYSTDTLCASTRVFLECSRSSRKTRRFGIQENLVGDSHFT